MEEKTKRFDIEKANELLELYKKKQHSGKISFLNELISYQDFFGNKTILDCNLPLKKNYQKRTIESVLSDLGYTLALPPIHFTAWGFFATHKRCVCIKFK